jgi:hypothetical protein
MSPERIAEQPVETMSKVTASTLKDYPEFGATARVRKSWPQHTDRKGGEAATADAAVLADLEAMFETTEDELPAAVPEPEPPAGD